jgi:arylsulfatase/uncharacterized sulfatase
MFDIVNDPGETRDLKAENPVQFQHMLNLYQRYAEENGVLPVPDHYSQDMEIALKMIQNQIGDEIIIYILVGATMVLFALFGWQRKKFMDKSPK